MKRLKRLEMMDGINLHALNQPVSEAGSLGNNQEERWLGPPT